MKIVKINQKKLTKAQLQYVEGKIKFDAEGNLTKETNEFIEKVIKEDKEKVND